MKKYIFSLFIIFVSVFAFATTDNYAHLDIYESMDKSFLEHFVYGRKITYQVCTYPFIEENEENHAKFLKALNIWLNTTEDYIKARKNGEKDFKDILRILKNIKNLKRVPCKYDIVNNNLALEIGNDLNVLFALRSEYDQELGSYNHKYKSISVNKYTEDEDYIYAIKDMPIILHELGHAFGLADRYLGAIHDGSYIYTSLALRPSVMMDYSTISDKITCDDVDGFITSIDRIRDKKRTFKSFCNDDIVLVNGTAQKIKPGYVYSYKEGFSYENANYDANIIVTYDKDSVRRKSYTLDVILENFEQAPGSINFIESLGFDTKNLDLSKEIKIRIHAPVREMKNGYRFATGLTTLFLTVNGKQEQAVIINYGSDDNEYMRFFYDSYIIKEIKGPIQLPIMHYSPDYQHGEIEDKIIIIIDKSLEELFRDLGIE